MTKKNDVTQQYESWANSYDDDKVEIIRKDVGIELEEFVDRILDHCRLNTGQKVIDVGTGTGLIAVSIAKRLSGDNVDGGASDKAGIVTFCDRSDGTRDHQTYRGERGLRYP